MPLEKKKIVVTGDSIAEDLSARTFQAAAEMAGIRISFNPHDPNSIDLYNTAMGGHTVEMIEARFHRDAVSLKPSIVIVNGGTNDLWSRDISDILFEESWRLILNQCKFEGIIGVILGIVPASGFPNEIMRTRDRWNGILKTLVSTYKDFVYVDADSYVGAYRSGGDFGNHWDISPEHDQDGVHFTESGSQKIALAILDSIKPLLV